MSASMVSSVSPYVTKKIIYEARRYAKILCPDFNAFVVFPLK